MIVRHEQLRRVAEAVLAALGSHEREAGAVSDHLVESNLRGHDSHGIGMLPAYVRHHGSGRLVCNRRPELARDDGTVVVFDGGNGFGQVLAREVTAWAIGRVRERGLCVVGLRNSQHVGRVGSYGEQAAEAGYVSVTFVNTISDPRLVAPHRGKEARLQTNPICIAVPGAVEEEPVILDFATSRIASNKVRVAHHQGRPVPEGSLIDGDGRPTTDPAVMYGNPRGALLPFGEHKGYGLALMCEILGGILTGNGTMQPVDEQGRGLANGMLTIMLDPGRLCGRAALDTQLGALIAYVRSAPAADPELPVLIPGEPERMARARRLTEGIPVDERTWRLIVDAAESVGVSRLTLNRLAAGAP